MALKAAPFLVALLLCLSTLPTTGTVSGQTSFTEISDGITLTGNESLVITNQNYIVNGSILIGDDASLTLLNSHLDFTESRRWKFELSGNGRLFLDNSDVNLTQPGTIRASGRSFISLIDSEVCRQFWCTIHLSYHYSYAIELGDESRLDASNSRIGYLITSTGSECSIRDSFIGDIWYRMSSCHLLNTTVDAISFSLSEGNYSCRLKLADKIPHWSSKLYGGGIPGDLTLENVTLNNPPMIEVVNCTLRLQDSNLRSLSCRGQSDISIDDSELMRLGLWGKENFVITNSSIGWLDSADGVVRSITIKDSRIDNATFTLEEEALIENSRIGRWESGWFGWVGGTRQIVIIDSNFKILTIDSHTEYSLRNVTVENRVWIQPDFNGIRETYIAGDLDYRGKPPRFDSIPSESIFYKVIRQFEVKVTRGGEPLKSAEIKLRSENGTIWSGISDGQGYARFNVTFSKVVVANPVPGQNPLVDTDNMTKTLTLLIEDGGDEQNVTFGLLSNAPLLVGFESLTGFQSALVAISMVAILIASVTFAFSRLVRRRLT